MELNEYQKEAIKTAIFPKEMGITYCILALNGEAGEVAEKWKKVIRDKGGVPSIQDVEAIKKELGDVAWYLANIAEQFGFTFEDVARTNLEKLASRQARGQLSGSGDER